MLRRFLFQDWAANSHDGRIRWMLVGFRLAQHVSQMQRFPRLLFTPYLKLYRVLAYSFFHMELNWTLKVGEGLRIYHGYCLVIHPNTRIGKNVTLRHCVTLGNKSDLERGTPVLEDGVQVGAHAVVIGPVTVGANAIIGAAAVVTRDVPPGAVVVGNPARVLSSRDQAERASICSDLAT